MEPQQVIPTVPPQPIAEKPARSNHRLKILLIIPVVLVVSIFSLVIYNKYNPCVVWPCLIDYGSVQVPINIQLGFSPTPTETSEWKTYRNEKYGFETKYNSESTPNEIEGNEDEGQFTYLLMINFGTNPLKFPSGYELRINNERPLEVYKQELVGHMADAIDSEEKTEVNDNTWTKLNYKIFLTTDDIPVTTAVIHHNS